MHDHTPSYYVQPPNYPSAQVSNLPPHLKPQALYVNTSAMLVLKTTFLPLILHYLAHLAPIPLHPRLPKLPAHQTIIFPCFYYTIRTIKKYHLGTFRSLARRELVRFPLWRQGKTTRVPNGIFYCLKSRIDKARQY